MNKVAPATFSYFDVGSGNGSDPEQIGFNIDEIVWLLDKASLGYCDIFLCTNWHYSNSLCMD